MKNLKLFFLVFLISNSDSIASTNTPVSNLFSNEIIEIGGYVLTFILGCISVTVYFNSKIKNILKGEYEEYKRQIRGKDEYPSFIFGVIQFLKERKEEYKNKPSLQNTESKENHKLQTLIVENRNLTQRNRDLEKKMFNSNDLPKNDVQNGEKLIPEQAEPINMQEPTAYILYFSLPEEDGSFLEDKASVTASARSYYKIEFLEGDRAAKLIYRSGNLDVSALSQMDYILSPVCEMEDSSQNNPTKIIIESQGTVVKEDDKWKIKDKIKLKLI